ncbi:MAG: NAD(P)/FAD-dependent oxidoreductase [Clostridiales bacterium]|nr:NAD(P)/FAD-dependent oxidoreductase [Clostridiales bacterium]
MAKIIVAGGGHGGIAVAGLLAEKGLDVTVYEQRRREDMGYDWTDIFEYSGLLAADMDMPPEDLFCYKGDVTFYGPSERNPFIQRSPKNQPEIKMERKDIYNYIIDYAEKRGAKFEYGVKIEKAECLGNRVVGIKTDKGSFYGDLIIDACGVNSPVRKSLPHFCGIQKELKQYEKLYVYRAFYNRINKDVPATEFKLTLFPNGLHGLGWVMAGEQYADTLLGKFEPFEKDEIKKYTDYLREKNPCVGKKKVRAGSFAEIPIRQTIAVMVADGYAAIGDSAFMTIPIYGSGIANALRASKILAETVLKDEDCAYSCETLWDYEYNYYKKVGSSLAPLATMKNLLIDLTPEQIDNLFDYDLEQVRGKIKRLNGLTDKRKVKAIIENVLILKNIVSDKALKQDISVAVKKIAKLSVLMKQMPKVYSQNEVLIWAQKYNKIFKYEK